MRGNQKKNTHLFNLCSFLFQIKIFYYCLLFTCFTGRRIDLVDKKVPKQVELAPCQNFQIGKISNVGMSLVFRFCKKKEDSLPSPVINQLFASHKTADLDAKSSAR